MVKEVGLLGKDIVHLGTRSFRGVLDAAVHSPLAKMIEPLIIYLSLCFFDPFFPTVMRTLFGNVIFCISNFLRSAFV